MYPTTAPKSPYKSQQTRTQGGTTQLVVLTTSQTLDLRRSKPQSHSHDESVMMQLGGKSVPSSTNLAALFFSVRF